MEAYSNMTHARDHSSGSGRRPVAHSLVLLAGLFLRVALALLAFSAFFVGHIALAQAF